VLKLQLLYTLDASWLQHFDLLLFKLFAIFSSAVHNNYIKNVPKCACLEWALDHKTEILFKLNNIFFSLIASQNIIDVNSKSSNKCPGRLFTSQHQFASPQALDSLFIPPIYAVLYSLEGVYWTWKLNKD